jgi:hypothetical protein
MLSLALFRTWSLAVESMRARKTRGLTTGTARPVLRIRDQESIS